MTKFASLSLEKCEPRCLPAAGIVQQGAILQVVGEMNVKNVIAFDPVGTQVRVTLNGKQSLYNGVNQIVAVGGNKADDISNNTNVSWTVDAKKGDDTILGGAGNDTYLPGEGNDVVYDLLGTNIIVANGDNDVDTVFTNFQSAAFVDKKDELITFFAPNRTPGAGTVSLENGVLYIAPSNNGTSVTLNEVGNKVVVTYDFNDGSGLQTFIAKKNDVKYIAYFGGAGNDTYVNNTKISEAAYGSAGNDVIVGGNGNFSLLKGSGGNDTVVGRAKRNDISGNAGSDVLIGGGKQNVFRTDILDTIFANCAKNLYVLS